VADKFAIVVDATAIVEALDRLGPRAQPYVTDACRISAANITTEIRARAARAFVSRTGETIGGIAMQPSADGIGFVVVDAEHRMPHLPAWLEHGTARMPAHPFFDAAARLEQPAHVRRISTALTLALEAEGLA
jgi:hypothetical protein